MVFAVSLIFFSRLLTHPARTDVRTRRTEGAGFFMAHPIAPPPPARTRGLGGAPAGAREDP